MALTYSHTLDRSFFAPDFTLPGVEGKTYQSADFSRASVLVIMFMCNHCPYVKAIEDRLIALSQEFSSKGVQFVGICSNDSTEYPEDAPEALFKRWKEKKYGFPYLIDKDQSVARAYKAQCTPDLYVFDHERRLAYHGRLDDHWQDAAKVTKRDLADAIQALLARQSVSGTVIPSMGCSIKWTK